MRDQKGSGDPTDLAEFELRAKLWEQDRLEGDRISMEQAAFRALGTAEEAYEPPVDVFKECSRGGSYKPRTPSVGDRVGDSIILREIGSVGRRGRLFEVTCASCSKPQIRSSGQLNRLLRSRYMVECPECRTERRSGERQFKITCRGDAILRRVQEGGPIYTGDEIQNIVNDVWSSLEDEFGSVDLDKGMCPDDVQSANGWPPSHYDRNPGRKEMAVDEIYESEQEELRRLGAPLADLVRAIEEGNAEDINQVSDRVHRTWSKEKSGPERNEQGLLKKVPYHRDLVEAALERAKEEQRAKEEKSRKKKKEKEKEHVDVGRIAIDIRVQELLQEEEKRSRRSRKEAEARARNRERLCELEDAHADLVARARAEFASLKAEAGVPTNSDPSTVSLKEALESASSLSWGEVRKILSSLK